MAGVSAPYVYSRVSVRVSVWSGGKPTNFVSRDAVGGTDSPWLFAAMVSCECSRIAPPNGRALDDGFCAAYTRSRSISSRVLPFVSGTHSSTNKARKTNRSISPERPGSAEDSVEDRESKRQKE